MKDIIRIDVKKYSDVKVYSSYGVPGCTSDATVYSSCGAPSYTAYTDYIEKEGGRIKGGTQINIK